MKFTGSIKASRIIFCPTLGGNAVDAEGKTPLPAAIESALRELGCDHISPEVTPYIHGNMNQ